MTTATSPTQYTYRRIEAGHYAMLDGTTLVARLVLWDASGSFPTWHAYPNPQWTPRPIVVAESLKRAKRLAALALREQAAAAPAGQHVCIVFSPPAQRVDTTAEQWPEPRYFDLANPPRMDRTAEHAHSMSAR